MPQIESIAGALGARAAQLPATGQLTLAELPFPPQTNLRGDPADRRFVDAVTGALGCAPPLVPNTVAEGGACRILWLGPDEWLVVGHADGEAVLREALAGLHAAATDVTGNRTVLALRGAAAREVLAKGCPLDLHPRLFGPGRCAQTLLAKAQIILEQRDGAPGYHLFVRPSFARYVADWLVDAMGEYIAR